MQVLSQCKGATYFCRYWAYAGSYGLVRRLGIVMCQFGLLMCLLYV